MANETNADAPAQAAGMDQGTADDQAGALAQVCLTLIERRRTNPLAGDLRALVLEALTAARAAWTAEEIAGVPDGTEPATVFRPLMRATARQEGADDE